MITQKEMGRKAKQEGGAAAAVGLRDVVLGPSRLEMFLSGLFVIHIILMLIIEVNEFGVHVGLIHGLWICSLSLVLASIGMYTCRPRFVACALCAVATGHFLWTADTLFMLASWNSRVDLFNIANYQGRKGTFAFFQIYTNSHHVWFMPTCIFYLRSRNYFLSISDLLRSALWICVISFLTALIVPVDRCIPSKGGVCVQLNTNMVNAWWGMEDVWFFHALDRKKGYHPVVFYLYANALHNLGCNGICFTMLRAIVGLGKTKPPPSPLAPSSSGLLDLSSNSPVRRVMSSVRAACGQPHSSLAAAMTVAAIYSLASVLFAYLELPVTSVVIFLPLVLAAAAVTVRGIRGVPETLLGIEACFNDSKSTPAKRPPRFTLVAMPVNHYGEKVRWCLDLIGAPFEESTQGGLVSAFLRGRSVPFLVDRQSCSLIGNSDECLAYLNAVHVPSIADVESKERAARLLRRDEATLLWEPILNELGHLIQGYCYFHIIGANASMRAPLTAWGAYEPKVPLWHRLILLTLGRALKAVMRIAFRLDDEEIQRRRGVRFDEILDKADAALGHHQFLAGSQITYVDVTFCALLAPVLASAVCFAQPSPYANGRFTSFYGAVDKNPFPAPLAAREQEILGRPCGKHVVSMYRNWRSKVL